MNIWFAYILLVVFAAAFLSFPWWRRKAILQDISDKDANILVYQEQLSSYKKQNERGEISEAEYESLALESKRLLLDNTRQGESKVLTQSSPLILLMLIGILTVSGIYLYDRLGAVEDKEISELFEKRDRLIRTHNYTPEFDKNLFEKVRERYDKRPGNRYYADLVIQFLGQSGNYHQAARFLETVLKNMPEDSYFLAEYAQILFLKAGQKVTQEVKGAIETAYRTDQSNSTVLGLKGVDAYQSARYRDAISFWKQAMASMPAGSDDYLALSEGIDKARRQLGETVSNKVVNIDVVVGEGVTFKKDQLVFVALVEHGGPPMPLAATRVPASHLPTTLSLSDQHSLVQSRPLSSVKQLVAVARISSTGSATPSPGDWEGKSSAFEMKNDQVSIKVVIDHQR